MRAQTPSSLCRAGRFLHCAAQESEAQKVLTGPESHGQSVPAGGAEPSLFSCCELVVECVHMHEYVCMSVCMGMHT
jgi:hypothetical protein